MRPLAGETSLDLAKTSRTRSWAFAARRLRGPQPRRSEPRLLPRPIPSQNPEPEVGKHGEPSDQHDNHARSQKGGEQPIVRYPVIPRFHRHAIQLSQKGS